MSSECQECGCEPEPRAPIGPDRRGSHTGTHVTASTEKCKAKLVGAMTKQGQGKLQRGPKQATNNTCRRSKHRSNNTSEKSSKDAARGKGTQGATSERSRRKENAGGHLSLSARRCPPAGNQMPSKLRCCGKALRPGNPAPWCACIPSSWQTAGNQCA